MMTAPDFKVHLLSYSVGIGHADLYSCVCVQCVVGRI